MSDLLAQAAYRFAELPFLIDDNSMLTFDGVDAAVSKRAKELSRGQSVALQPGVDIASVVEILAILRADSQAVLVPKSWPAALIEERVAYLPVQSREVIVFTSGTSGRPKPVRLTESNWAAAASGSAIFFGFGPGQRWLVALPLFHVSGLSIVYRALVAGGTALLSTRLEPEILDEAEFASLVPAQLWKLSEERSKPPRAAIVVGGAALSDPLAGRTSGWKLHRTYGTTETAAVVASGSPESQWMAVLSGLEVLVNDEGRLMVRGPQVSPGYAGGPSRAEGEWFLTSDFGSVRGHEIAVTGRADRVINTGGEKVDPAEIEELISRETTVSDAVAFGLPDERWGEVVAVAYTGPAASEELAALVESRLGPVARPRVIRRVDVIPRNELGKVDTRTLRSLFLPPVSPPSGGTGS